MIADAEKGRGSDSNLEDLRTRWICELVSGFL